VRSLSTSCTVALLTYEGTAEIQTLLVGRDITGHSAFA